DCPSSFEMATVSGVRLPFRLGSFPSLLFQTIIWSPVEGIRSLVPGDTGEGIPLVSIGLNVSPLSDEDDNCWKPPLARTNIIIRPSSISIKPGSWVMISESLGTFSLEAQL